MRGEQVVTTAWASLTEEGLRDHRAFGWNGTVLPTRAYRSTIPVLIEDRLAGMTRRLPGGVRLAKKDLTGQEAEVIGAAIMAGEQRIAEAAAWFDLLWECYQRSLSAGGSLLTKPSDDLLSAACDQVRRRRAAAGATEAEVRRVFGLIARPGGALRVAQLDDLIRRPDERAQLQARLDAAWAVPPSVPTRSDYSRRAESTLSELVAAFDSGLPVSELLWESAVGFSIDDDLLSATRVDLGGSQPPSRPALDGAARAESAPLDRPIRRRLAQLLQGNGRPIELTPTEALTRTINLSVEPYGIADRTSRAVFTLGDVAYRSLTVDFGGARRLRASYRRGARAAGYEAQADPRYAVAQRRLRNGDRFARANLWSRLFRAELLADDPLSPTEAWETIVSVARHVGQEAMSTLCSCNSGGDAPAMDFGRTAEQDIIFTVLDRINGAERVLINEALAMTVLTEKENAVANRAWEASCVAVAEDDKMDLADIPTLRQAIGWAASVLMRDESASVPAGAVWALEEGN